MWDTTVGTNTIIPSVWQRSRIDSHRGTSQALEIPTEVLPLDACPVLYKVGLELPQFYHRPLLTLTRETLEISPMSFLYLPKYFLHRY